MNVEGISISLEEVKSSAGTIRTINNGLDAKLAEVKKAMNDMSNSWKSPAGETIKAKFTALEPKFQEYKEIIESYAKFLDTTVDSYQATENAVNNNASAFK